MDDYDTFKNKIIDYEDELNLKECEMLAQILKHSIDNKIEVKQLDKSYYWKCDSVKKIMEQSDIIVQDAKICDISKVGLREQIKGDYMMPYINTINLKTKKIYFDKEYHIDVYYRNKYKTYELYYQWKEVIDLIDKIKK